MTMLMRKWWGIVKQAAVSWNADNAPTMGAALAYYTVFSLAPLLLLAISMASQILGETAARTGISHELRRTLGTETAESCLAMLDNVSSSGASFGITLIGSVTLLIGASGAFVQLQEALNVIWKAEAPPRTGGWLMHFIRNRLLSFLAVFIMGITLVAVLLVSATITWLSKWLDSAQMPVALEWWHGVSRFVSFSVVTMLTAVIFRFLPDAPVRWRDVWIGALLTAGLFTLGQHLIGLYLGLAGMNSMFGAAGFVMVVLTWVYYSAQIVLFGAEFTYAYANLAQIPWSGGGHSGPPPSLGSASAQSPDEIPKAPHP